jgi:hypothetical protein
VRRTAAASTHAAGCTPATGRGGRGARPALRCRRRRAAAVSRPSGAWEQPEPRPSWSGRGAPAAAADHVDDAVGHAAGRGEGAAPAMRPPSREAPPLLTRAGASSVATDRPGRAGPTAGPMALSQNGYGCTLPSTSNSKRPDTSHNTRHDNATPSSGARAG